MSKTVDKRSKQGAAGRFAVGFGLGLTVFPAAVLAAYLMIVQSGTGQLLSGRGGRSVLVASGQDMTAAKAASLSVIRTDEATTLACRGACDDLRLDGPGPSALERVEVKDASDTCLLCERTASGHGRFNLSGRPLALLSDAQP